MGELISFPGNREDIKPKEAATSAGSITYIHGVEDRLAGIEAMVEDDILNGKDTTGKLLRTYWTDAFERNDEDGMERLEFMMIKQYGVAGTEGILAALKTGFNIQESLKRGPRLRLVMLW